MKKIVFLLVAGCFFASGYAQQDPVAKASLEKSVALIKSSAVKISFSTTIETAAGKKSSVAGTLTMMGNKYKLLMNGSEAYFDGKTQYLYVPENKEVTISTIPAKDQKRMNPLSVLSQYSGKDTKIQFSSDGQTTANSVAIDLFPTAKMANEFRIAVKLNKKTSAPQWIKLFSKDGSKTTIAVSSFQKIPSDDKLFIFNVKAHPNVSVNDLR